MPDSSPSLTTRWSMLDGLRGQRAEESWRWFIERYRPYIRACISRLIRPRDRADQATDEVWSYLFTSAMLENADRDRCFRTYLAGTVRNYAYAWMRKHTEAGASESEVPRALVAPDAQEHEIEDMRLWKSQVLVLALEELAKRNAEQVQVLRWFYGLPDSVEGNPTELRPVSWIARELGLQANAVHQIVFRARKRLRLCIENELKETVRDEADLEEEMRLLYTVIEEESPGLSGQVRPG